MSKKKKQSERSRGMLSITDALFPGGVPSEPEKELDPTLDLISQSFKHCDEYIEDEAQPAVLRKFLDRARMPGHGMMSKEPYPQLYATYNGREWRGVSPGNRVRVVMASRMGDVGCTKDLTADSGYQVRCAVSDLSDFSDQPY